MVDAPSELLSINPVTKKPVKTVLPNAQSGRVLVQRMVTEDQPRNYQRALVEGQVWGKPPYSDAKRRQNGLGWTCNLNFMEGEGIIESARVPYYAIFNGVEQYADCCTSYQKDSPDNTQWGRVISGHFSKMLKRWPKFDWNMQNGCYQMLLHGIGPAFFDSPLDWRFRALKSGSVLVPQGSPSSVDDTIPYIAIRIKYRVHELWMKIKDEAAAKEAGWDVGAIKNTILWAANGNQANSEYPLTWTDFEAKWKNNELVASYENSQVVACVHLLTQEYSGKVSHFIYTESELVYDDNRKPTAESEERDGFLFRSIDKYDNYTRALAVFFQNSGIGDWHSVRGLASKMFKHLEVSNRLMCRAVDGVFIKGSLILQPQNPKSTDKLQLMQIGPVTVIPPGANIQPVQMNGATDELLAVSRVLGNHLSNNVGMFKSTLSREDGRGEMPTATQVQAQVQKESTLSQGQMTLFYSTLDVIYSEVYRRASDPNTNDKEAREFQAACIADGVPAEALTEMEYVRANRVSGYGSPQMRQLVLQQLGQLAPMFPEEGKMNWLRDGVGATAGADKVERYVPQQRVPGTDEWQANQENGMVHQGIPPLIVSGQNDEIHLHSHLEDAANTLEPLSQAIDAGQADPAALDQAYTYVQIMAAHVEQHLQRLQADPIRKGQAAFFKEKLAQIVGFSGKLHSAIRQAQRDAEVAALEEQQATALGALDQAKVDQVTTQTQLNAVKTASDVQNKRLKVVNDLRLKSFQAAQEARLKQKAA